MKVVAVVQARTNSTRFPCKVVASLHGRPMLAHVLERAAAVKGVDQVVLAIPGSDHRILGHLWPTVSCGPEKDVLARFHAAAFDYQADVVVRITGDCPLLAPDLVERALAAWKTTGGYVALCMPYSPVADGMDAEVFPWAALRDANEKATKHEREHVTTWLRSNMPVVSIPTVPHYDLPKLSVDTREDLARVDKVMACLDDPRDFSHRATLAAWEKAGKP